MKKYIMVILIGLFFLTGCEHELWRIYLEPNDVENFTASRNIGTQSVLISYNIPQMDLFEATGETDHGYDFAVCLYYTPPGSKELIYIDKAGIIDDNSVPGNLVNSSIDMTTFGLSDGSDYLFTCIVRDMYNQPSPGVSVTVTW